MSRYYQPLNNSLKSEDLFANPVTWIIIIVVIALGVVGYLWYSGYFSSSRDNRLFYNPNSAITNVSDPNPLDRIRANDFSALQSQTDPIKSAGVRWAGTGPRKILSYILNKIPEPVVTNNVPLPPQDTQPIVNPTPSVDTMATMMPEIPPLSSARYTNLNFGSTQDLNDSTMQGRLAGLREPLNTPTYGGGLERRTSKRTPY